MTPDRILPDPLPPVEPQWEFEVGADLKDAYRDYKRLFQVPWVGVVSMAYARYRSFYDCWWEGLREVVDTRVYVESAFALRQRIEMAIGELEPTPIASRLRKLGYSARELDNIRDIIEFLSHGNFIQIPAVFAARLLLEGGSLGRSGVSAAKYGGRHAVECETPFILMEPHHVSPDTRALYGEVMDRLGLPFVNTDYRALARWPSYFAMAWADLRDHLGKPAHERLAGTMHEAIFETVSNLPNPAGLDAQKLIAAAERDGPVERIRDTTRLFTHLIPGLVVNVAFFRHQLR